MESVGEILRALAAGGTASSTSSEPSGEDTGISSATEAEGASLKVGQGDCPLCQGAGFVRARVAPGHPDFGRAIPCVCAEEMLRAEKVARLLRHSNLGPLARLTFETLLPEGRGEDPLHKERFAAALALARRYAEEPEGWLVLLGPSGCGKTHLAAAIANQRIQQGQPAFFVVVPDLLDHLRTTFGPDSEVGYDTLFDHVRNCPLLVLDDLGSQSSTPWAQEKLYQILNHRYNARLPTVVTTSCPLEGLEDRVRTRLSDPGLARVCVVALPRKGATAAGVDALALEALREMTFEGFVPKPLGLSPEQCLNLEKAFRHARNFAERPEGWLVFLGKYGCGKTHLAAAIANYRLSRGQPATFVVVPDLLDHLRSTYSPGSAVAYDEVFEAVRTSPLLILDDLGTQSSTPWAQEKLYQIINYRYNAKLPTVITSNYELENIEGRLCSRMLDGALSKLYAIEAPDYRGGREPAAPSEARPMRRRRSVG